MSGENAVSVRETVDSVDRAESRRALALTKQEPERRFLERRLRALER